MTLYQRVRVAKNEKIDGLPHFCPTKFHLAALKNVKAMANKVKLVFDRKGTVAKTGTGKIEICIYLKAGERKYVTVGTSTPTEWEIEAQSKAVVSKVKHYENVVKAMEVLGEEMTMDNFNKHIFISEKKTPDSLDKKYMYNGNDQRQSFIGFIEEYLEKEGLRAGSKRNIEVVIDSLKNSKIIKTFEDLTPTKLIKYDEYLHNQGDKSLATIYNYHKKIHKYTHILWRNEMIPSDPYNHVQFKRGSHKERQPLTEDELLTLREAEFSAKLSRARDLFIFMAYTGLAYIDMCNFDFKTMTEKKGKFFYIDGERIKTGSKFYTPILPPALEVLKKYNYKLPIITNQKLNDYLDVIREKLDWKKKITCHVARHSFATLLLTYNFSIEKTARALGHKNIKTTQVYAKVLKKSIEESTEQLALSIR